MENTTKTQIKYLFRVKNHVEMIEIIKKFNTGDKGNNLNYLGHFFIDDRNNLCFNFSIDTTMDLFKEELDFLGLDKETNKAIIENLKRCDCTCHRGKDGKFIICHKCEVIEEFEEEGLKWKTKN